MLTDDAFAFARVALELNILSQKQLLAAVAQWGAEGAREPLRTHLVRSGILDEEQALTVARATALRPSAGGLRGTGYEIGEVLGRGANGVVHLATDTSLRREVALKMHSRGADMSNVELLRFTHEAQVTGQLGHPGVVPVYDLGTLPDGRPYYTMRRIGGSCLKEVFAALKRQEPEFVSRWTLTHMIVVLLRVAQALAFAHDRGVIHRDVKPANIMAGDYGEVLLLDWGVARVLGESRDGDAPGDTWRSVGGEDLTVDGPQARGDIEAIGPAADVYSVGVILYEFLCGKRPFRARNIQGLLDMVVSDAIVPISQRELKHPLPPDLAALCMRCLSKKVKDRFANGSELSAALEDFLEGSRKQEQAEKFTAQGLERLHNYKQASDWAREEETKLRALEADLPPWAGTDERRAVWQQAASWGEQRKERDDIYDEASTLLQGALQYSPGHRPAQQALGQLFLRKLVEAEERGEKNAASFFRKQVRLHDAALLRNVHTEVSLAIEPRGARVTLFRLREQDRILEPDHRTPLQNNPIDKLNLEGGSYTLSLEHEGHIPITAAVHTANSLGDRCISLSLRMPRLDEVAQGFTVIPAGSFQRGGDPLSIDGQRPAEIELKTFAIGRHPVTQLEFREWLQSDDSPAEAARSFHWWDELNEVPEQDRARLPALGVPLALAEAYARWRSTETGFRLRLPANDEWE